MQVKRSRRRFLGLLTTIPVLSGFFALEENTSPEVTVQTTPTDFDYSSALQRVTNPSLAGQKYLELRAVENKPMSAEYFQSEIETITDTPCKHSSVDKLLAAIDEDFKSDNSLLIDGWIFSKTECTLCALTVLSG